MKWGFEFIYIYAYIILCTYLYIYVDMYTIEYIPSIQTEISQVIGNSYSTALITGDSKKNEITEKQ